MAYENQIDFFNLNNDGDSAIIRLLHTGVKSIDKAVVHTVEVEGRKKTIGCCGDGCPICANGIKSFERIFVHLWDYADGKEKVWSRTPTILTQFTDLETSWGDLSNVVFKITRKGKEFPKYDIMILPPNNYMKPDASLLDKQIGYRYYMHRTSDELKVFFATGTMPKHETKPFVSKEEYMKQKNGANTSQTSTAQTTVTRQVSASTTVQTPKTVSNPSDDDVFIDPFDMAKPRRV